MYINLDKIKISLSLLVFVGVVLFFSSCYNNTDRVEVILKVKVIDKITKGPREGDKVEVINVKKPLFTMWQYVKIMNLTTDNIGVVNFKTFTNRRLRIIVYGSENEYNFTEFEVKDIKPNETIIIELTSKNK
ncbi:MAG: hypothetical protein COB98_01690 [Flavobacteriaceae bacterium]|nr:MAG: hypothetical protein COB98_01690 [Flavobacteriaceae bacterium]